MDIARDQYPFTVLFELTYDALISVANVIVVLVNAAMVFDPSSRSYSSTSRC